MKSQRQEKILSIIQNHTVTTQEELHGGGKNHPVGAVVVDELAVAEDFKVRQVLTAAIGRSPLEPEFVTFGENEFFEILTAKIKQRG